MSLLARSATLGAIENPFVTSAARRLASAMKKIPRKGLITNIILEEIEKRLTIRNYSIY
jgi:hypothetical protein